MILSFSIIFIVIIISIIIHEYSHAWAACQLGDNTAKYAGRLTLNPKAHVDLWGTILMPLLLFFASGFMFGYAKPVPYNPYNLRDQKWGPVWVAIAGPLSNFLLAFVFAVLLKYVNVGNELVLFFFQQIIRINVVLLVFNLVPIPPLDGSKVLYALLPPSANNIRIFLDRYGFMILLIFVFFLFELISPIINGLVKFLITL